MRGAVKGLTSKGLLMKRAVRIAIEKTANFIFQLMDSRYRLGHKLPCHILIGKPFAANDRIHKMPLNRILWIQCHIIAALNHARAARFSNQPFNRNGDFLIWCRFLRVKGGK